MTPILTKILSFFLMCIQSVSLFLCGAPLSQTIAIKTDIKYQTFESFGTSSAWWSQNIDDADTAQLIANALYGDEGLNLSVYRYNVGGGEADNPASRIWDTARRAESFYVYNELTGEYEFDFTRDANAIRMLDAAIANGADSVILFCNSPHYSMTASGHASGGFKDAESNLPKENYQAFVDYLLTIADWFIAQGYPVTAISPINEPQWGWGGEWVGQEGCHYTADEAVELLELFALTMQERGVSYKLSGVESGQLSKDYYDYIDKFCKSEILSKYCDTYSGHSYWMDNDIDGKRKAGYRIAGYGMKFEMSEWCELPMTLDSATIDSGLYMANIIIQDLTLLNAVSWQSWTAVNGDGVLDIDSDSNLTHHNRYYAYKQFSSFIKPQMTRINVTDSFCLASDIASTAFTDGEQIILVLLNNSDSETNIKLAGDYTSLEIYTTDAKKNCELTFSGEFSKEQALAAKSINTFVLY